MEWKTIDETPNYEVSSTGLIRNANTQQILNGTITKKGYRRTNLYINGKPKARMFHRLVAKAFIPNPENKPEINHKDGNKLNNNVENLEWCTTQENIQHADKNNLRTNSFGNRKRVPVVRVHPLTGEKKYYDELKAVKQDGFNPDNVSAVINGRREHHRGFYWYKV